MNKQDTQFLNSRKDFQKLRQGKEIPPQMQVKLDYLLAKIDKLPIQNTLVDALPEYEKNSLDLLNIDTAIQLFNNIINCLSGKEVVLYFRNQRAYIRKDQFFTMWKECWLSCDSEQLTVCKKIQGKPLEVLEVVNFRISKNFKLYKKKYVFGVCYNKKKNYLIGLEFEASCARIHSLIRNLIRQRVNKKSERSQKSQQISQISVSRVVQNSQNKTMKSVKFSKQKEQNQQNQRQTQNDNNNNEVDQNSDMGVVIQFIKAQDLNGDSMYKLMKSQANLRMLVHKNYPNKLKNYIILPKPKQIYNLLDSYLRMNQWNPAIQQCSIKIKLTDNSYLLQVRVAKYSYLSWPREAVLLATALSYRGNYFLVIRSTGDECSYTDTVSFQWNQVVEVCQSEDKVLMSISSQMDFKGYSSLEDSQKMGLKVLDSLKYFTKYYQAKQIDSKSSRIFNLNHNVQVEKYSNSSKQKEKETWKSEQMIKSRKMSQGSQIQMQLPDDDNSRDEKSQRTQKIQIEKTKMNKNEEQDPQNFTMYMLKDVDSQVSPKLIELVKVKAQQKYYLKHKFDQEPHYDPKRCEHVVEVSNHYILQNKSWIINQEQDLIFVNQKVMDIQKDVIKMIIKQLGSNIMSGKSIMNMSLPVEVFDHRSILERVAMGLGYAPKFLVPAAETDDLIEQAKLVALFILGIGPLHLCLSKPFNPILGETFECRIGGIPLYLEQVSHHPPISAILMKTESFTLHGAFHSHAEMGLNRVTGKNLCPLYIDFSKTNTFYEIKLPDVQISGLIHGDKKYRSLGKCFILERTNNKFIQWSLGKDKKKVYQAEGKIKSNDVYGGIFTVSPGFAKKFKDCQNKLKFDGLKSEDIIQTHCKMTGHWCFDILFDGVKMKTMTSPLPNKIEYCQYLLPSDSNFRTDLLYKRSQDLKTANLQKQILENIQRKDRKLREGKVKPS